LQKNVSAFKMEDELNKLVLPMLHF
jgi:hypothetical protein